MEFNVSKVFMNKKSAYINAELLYKSLTEHFIPLKPHGKVLLILDGHSSHSTAPDMLQAATDNNIILLCLPSHTTSALQPLDRAVFGPFKTYFNHETNQFMRLNPNKKISRYNAGIYIMLGFTLQPLQILLVALEVVVFTQLTRMLCQILHF